MQQGWKEQGAPDMQMEPPKRPGSPPEQPAGTAEDKSGGAERRLTEEELRSTIPDDEATVGENYSYESSTEPAAPAPKNPFEGDDYDCYEGIRDDLERRVFDDTQQAPESHIW